MKTLKTMTAAAGIAMMLTGAAFADSKVVAKVNGVEITQQDLDFARAELGEQLANAPAENLQGMLLLYLIENQLLANAAKKEKMDQGDQSEALMKYYQRRALHDAYYNKKIRGAVTDDQLKKIYDEQVAKIKPQTEYRARHILVKNEQDAKDIIKRLNGGSDFAELAKEKSTGPSGPQGGDLGYFTKGRMVPEFEEATTKLKKGDISEPVKTQFGWHVIKLEDVRESKPPSFDDVKTGLKSSLVRQKALETVGALHQAAEIDILDEELKKVIQAIEEKQKRGSFAQ